MAGAARRHFRQHRGDAVEHALDVDVDHPVPLVDLQRGHERERHDAGIVDDHVDAAEGFARRVGEGGDIGAVGDVETLRQHFAALARDLFGKRLQPIGATGAEHELRAGAAELPGDAAPMPLDAPVMRTTLSIFVSFALGTASRRLPGR